MNQMIYMLSASQYHDDLLDGFAIDGGELKQLAINNYCHDCQRARPDDITISIDLKAGTLTITDDGDEIPYYIFRFERVLMRRNSTT